MPAVTSQLNQVLTHSNLHIKESTIVNFKSTTSFKALLVAVPLAISAVGFSGESAKATNLFQDSVIGGFCPPLSSPVTVENSGKPATGAFNTILDDFTLRYD